MADKLGGLGRGWIGAVILALALCVPGRLAGQVRQDRATATFSGTQYLVHAGDVLRVRIWGWPNPESEIEGSFPVEESGVAYLPVIGAMNVAGKKAEQVQDEFRQRFAQEQRNPVVTVTPLFAVSVMGEVRGPGVIDVAPGYTMFDAISTAGGFNESANRKTLLLVRQNRTEEIGGATAAETAALLARQPLESGDRIVVLASRTARAQTWYTLLQALLTTTSIVLLLTR